jgi:flagellar biosynthesis/type III secretory pathway protein FliH
MNIEKITKKIEKFGEESYEEGYSIGWDSGYDAGYESAFNEGIEEHKRAMTFRLNSLFDTYMKTNKFKDAQNIKELMEYLGWEFDPEAFDRIMNGEDQ